MPQRLSAAASCKLQLKQVVKTSEEGHAKGEEEWSRRLQNRMRQRERERGSWSFDWATCLIWLESPKCISLKCLQGWEWEEVAEEERERRLRMLRMLQASHNLATFIEQMKLCADEEIWQLHRHTARHAVFLPPPPPSLSHPLSLSLPLSLLRLAIIVAVVVVVFKFPAWKFSALPFLRRVAHVAVATTTTTTATWIVCPAEATAPAIIHLASCSGSNQQQQPVSSFKFLPAIFANASWRQFAFEIRK